MSSMGTLPQGKGDMKVTRKWVTKCIGGRKRLRGARHLTRGD